MTEPTQTENFSTPSEQPTDHSQPTQSPQTLPSSKPSKLTAIVGIVLVFVITCVVGAYAWWQQRTTTMSLSDVVATPVSSPVVMENEMEGWETYTNKTYNFSFKFPSNWTIGSYGGSNIPVEEADSFKMSGPYENIQTLTPKYNISIEVSQNESNSQRTDSSIVKVLKAEENFVSFKLSSAEVPTQPLEDTEFFDQILSTFEFVDDVSAMKEGSTYKISSLGLEFELPETMSKYGELVSEVIPGEKGNQLCYTFPRETTFLVKSVYAGGAACPIVHFGLGTTSVDFDAGREGGFTDFQGFETKDSKYYGKFPNNKLIEIPLEVVEKVDNPNGVEILKVKYKDLGVFSPTPREGEIGALINIENNQKYTGIAIKLELKDGHTEEEFDQILSSFQFTE